MSNVSDTPATGVLDDLELYTRLFRQMLLIRGFEDLVQSLFLAGEVYGTTHLYSGQEAIAPGVASVLAVEPADLAWGRAAEAVAAFGRPVRRIGLDPAFPRALRVEEAISEPSRRLPATPFTLRWHPKLRLGRRVGALAEP